MLRNFQGFCCPPRARSRGRNRQHPGVQEGTAFPCPRRATLRAANLRRSQRRLRLGEGGARLRISGDTQAAPPVTHGRETRGISKREIEGSLSAYVDVRLERETINVDTSNPTNWSLLKSEFFLVFKKECPENLQRHRQNHTLPQQSRKYLCKYSRRPARNAAAAS